MLAPDEREPRAPWVGGARNGAASVECAGPLTGLPKHGRFAAR